ncbi:uracil-DNA glycosylase-like protein [Pisolithus croceorrhizus]|nr:uracil-DNA glycosylase-like protein [Pisolithus sp. B1]KAI6117561.1 uracil-DNA glycosylase-like protein [Pisolithus croceorrhizus]
MQPASRSVIGKATTVVTRKRIATTSVVARDTKRRRAEVKSTTTVTTFVGISDCTHLLESLEQDTLGESWREALQTEFSKPYFRKLKDFLISEHKSHVVYPPIKDIYSWSRLTPLESVKVIVLGQDPYHNTGQAHGLSFSVLPPTKLPGSLKNIYKQLSIDVPTFKPPLTGDLTPLAREGVLWLNTCLTVRAHTPNSHSKRGWESFTDAVIKAVLDREGDRGVVFFAWGLPAQKTCERLAIDEDKHLVLRSAHPSPLSAHRGFLGNSHFEKANEWLRETNGSEIDWTTLCSGTTG